MVSEFFPPNAEIVKGLLQVDDGSTEDWDKPSSGVLTGHSCFALSKIQDFFENHNLYIIYLWHMIAKHQLISLSMNMLADLQSLLEVETMKRFLLAVWH